MMCALFAYPTRPAVAPRSGGPRTLSSLSSSPWRPYACRLPSQRRSISPRGRKPRFRAPPAAAWPSVRPSPDGRASTPGTPPRATPRTRSAASAAGLRAVIPAPAAAPATSQSLAAALRAFPHFSLALWPLVPRFCPPRVPAVCSDRKAARATAAGSATAATARAATARMAAARAAAARAVAAARAAAARAAAARRRGAWRRRGRRRHRLGTGGTGGGKGAERR